MTTALKSAHRFVRFRLVEMLFVLAILWFCGGGGASAQSVEVKGDLKLSSGDFYSDKGARIRSSASGDYYCEKSDSGYSEGVYIKTDQSYGGVAFRDYAGNGVAFVGCAGANHGRFGINNEWPSEALDVYGVAAFCAQSTPDAATGKAKLWAETISGTTELRCRDSAGNQAVTLSPHNFSLYQPAANDPLPWSYYAENCFIGKKVNVDMSGAVRALERLTGQQFIYVADLPTSKVVNVDDWKAKETERLTTEAKLREIDKDPWVEIPFAQAWEEVDEVETRVETHAVTKYCVNWDTMKVESYQDEQTQKVLAPTGRRAKALKAGVRFDETNGKFFRKRTLDDVTGVSVPEPTLPQYVLTRVPAH